MGSSGFLEEERHEGENERGGGGQRGRRGDGRARRTALTEGKVVPSDNVEVNVGLVVKQKLMMLRLPLERDIVFEDTIAPRRRQRVVDVIRGVDGPLVLPPRVFPLVGAFDAVVAHLLPLGRMLVMHRGRLHLLFSRVRV